MYLFNLDLEIPFIAIKWGKGSDWWNYFIPSIALLKSILEQFTILRSFICRGFVPLQITTSFEIELSVGRSHVQLV